MTKWLTDGHAAGAAIGFVFWVGAVALFLLGERGCWWAWFVLPGLVLALVLFFAWTTRKLRRLDGMRTAADLDYYTEIRHTEGEP